MTVPRRLSGDLQCDRVEALVVAVGVTEDQRFDLSRCRHWMLSTTECSMPGHMMRATPASRAAAGPARRTAARIRRARR